MSPEGKRFPPCSYLLTHMRVGVFPVLHQLLHQCTLTEYAYLCNPCVVHVSKLKKEGT